MARHEAAASVQKHSHDDPHLRSGNAVMPYSVHATDGDIAVSKDFWWMT